MTKKIPLKSGDEQDALTGWRKVYSFGRGEIKKIKRRYNKRMRRYGKNEIERNKNE